MSIGGKTTYDLSALNLDTFFGGPSLPVLEDPEFASLRPEDSRTVELIITGGFDGRTSVGGMNDGESMTIGIDVRETEGADAGKTGAEEGDESTIVDEGDCAGAWNEGESTIMENCGCVIGVIVLELEAALEFRSTIDEDIVELTAGFAFLSTTDEARADGAAALRSVMSMLGPVGILGDDLPSVIVGVPASEPVALAILLAVRAGIRASLNFEVFSFVSIAGRTTAAGAVIEVEAVPSTVGVATAVRSPSASALSLLFSGAPYAASSAFTSASDLSSIVAPTFSTSPLLIASNHRLAFAFSSSSPKSSMSSSSEAHGGATSLSFSSSFPVRMARATGGRVVEEVEVEEGRMEAPRDWEGVLRGRVVL